MTGKTYLGLDVGSTTAKLILVSEDGRVIAARYRRHGAAARRTLALMLRELADADPDRKVVAGVTGSASLGLSEALGLPFVQEVMAASKAVSSLAPETDVAVELGGEDAKILYLSQGMDLRMNEACAGGTGAFIDQMASLLHTDASGLDALAASHKRIYPIASRCGVFAKTDVVPLLNEGAAREDVAASIFQAVVEQTISGLACGNPIRGRVAFLGGPLHFLPQLRARFVETLKLSPEETIVFPSGQYMVALGVALSLAESSVGVRKNDLSAEAAAEEETTLEELARRAETRAVETVSSAGALPPLFKDEAEYKDFLKRHERDFAPRKDLKDARGPLYLGVDLGSTTVKTVLTDEEGAVLATSYQRNQGDPLRELLPCLADLLDRIPEGAKLRTCAATGYGASLAQAALDAAFSEVETVAHLKAACALVPDATYVVDIGGQDMKCLKAEDGVIAGVTLNEACSAGCGAFLETFARSLDLSMEEFVAAALYAERPVDLGSRCTVFMNSKVKQAQKEGASIGDISAGLCYSVAKNALYKVLRLRSPEELGPRVIVQGGSFVNDALLRVMERLLGREVYRPDLAGLMGAYGAALLAKERAASFPESTLTADDLRSLKITTRAARCQGCGNHCLLTVNRFSNGRRLVSGNRCERGASMGEKKTASAPNLYAWKLKRLFDYEPLPLEKAPRGRLGIPRALNMYERYPFWFTLFTKLGFRVELSPPSGKEIYDLGLSSMPSQTVRYPAKLVHGHATWLIRAGIKDIFYPCIIQERKEWDRAADCYNCPVVCGYPEVVRLNTDELREAGCRLHSPFLQPWHVPSMAKELSKEFGVPAREIRRAAQAAQAEQDAYQAELRAEAERILEETRASGGLAVVLAGRPYHADPAVHHGLPELIASLGASVLSEDGVAHLAPDSGELRVVDQWTYHSRLYRAAALACSRDDLELVQLTSFGCGIDAITADQVSEILRAAGKLHTLIKIDEGAALGAARIRVRSLLAAVEERRRTAAKKQAAAEAAEAARKAEAERLAVETAGKAETEVAAPGAVGTPGTESSKPGTAEKAEAEVSKAGTAEKAEAEVSKAGTEVSTPGTAEKAGTETPEVSKAEAEASALSRIRANAVKPVFTEAMRETHVILAPQMAPIHFDLLEAAVDSGGYRLKLLPQVSRADIETGLDLVHNDACYPALVVIGQLVRALKSGDFDPDRASILLAQTCGPCRATNYISLLRKALCAAGFPQVPVLSLSGGSHDVQPGFQMTRELMRRMILATLYGDMLQRVSLSCRAHEVREGDVDELLAVWTPRAKEVSSKGDEAAFKEDMAKIVRDFSAIPTDGIDKPKVGIVGEILLKYHPDANNHVADLVRREGGEPVLTDLIDFFLYCLLDPVFRWKHLGGAAVSAFGNWIVIQLIERLRGSMRKALAGSRFMPASRISELMKGVSGVVSLGNQAGEGWLLTAEMLELVDHGAPNVLCLQPFGCLPNHITGKGVVKEIKRLRPHANLMAVDYDPGSSEANQINRIKLFMSVAHARAAEKADERAAKASSEAAERRAANLKTSLEDAEDPAA